MKHFKFKLTIIIATICIVSCRQTTTDYQSVTEINVNPIEDKIEFPDFGFMISSKDYNGRVFKLSDDFPNEMPVKDKALENILSIDFKSDWEGYLSAVQQYAFEGNATTDYENAFFLEDNTKRNWYHVPWQHWGATGREGFHGLTNEGPVASQMLAQSQQSSSHAYAVGFYNDLGGYTIGKVWPSGVPNYTSLKHSGFPEGTVVAKLLFVPIDEDEVPYLENPVSWDAYIYEEDIPGNTTNDSKARKQHKVNVIQMDIMVKDPRAKETGGWVFGTFVYQGNLGNENRWDNLMPVGIMWGNDPEDRLSSYNLKPTKTIINSNLKETIINPSPNLPPMHLGWNSRLNGPVDNGQSSCFSCHSTAEYPVISGILPQFNTPKQVPVPPKDSIASDEWMRWYRNIPCGEPFDAQATSFDFSLQLVKSVQNYIEYASEAQGGIYHEDYWSNNNKIRRNQIKK
jgi:hypothetical protein